MAKLRDSQQMLAKLREILSDPHADRLYNELLQIAGKDLDFPSVVVRLTMSIENYAAGLPGVAREALWGLVPSFLDAMLEDEEAAEQAKTFYHDAIAK